MSRGPFKRHYQKIHIAEAEMQRAIRRKYPIGSEIRWLTGGDHGQCGEVTMHGSRDRVRVLNWRTGKEYWIDAHNILA